MPMDFYVSSLYVYFYLFTSQLQKFTWNPGVSPISGRGTRKRDSSSVIQWLPRVLCKPQEATATATTNTLWNLNHHHFCKSVLACFYTVIFTTLNLLWLVWTFLTVSASQCAWLSGWHQHDSLETWRPLGKHLSQSASQTLGWVGFLGLGPDQQLWPSWRARNASKCTGNWRPGAKSHETCWTWRAKNTLCYRNCV